MEFYIPQASFFIAQCDLNELHPAEYHRRIRFDMPKSRHALSGIPKTSTNGREAALLCGNDCKEWPTTSYTFKPAFSLHHSAL